MDSEVSEETTTRVWSTIDCGWSSCEKDVECCSGTCYQEHGICAEWKDGQNAQKMEEENRCELSKEGCCKLGSTCERDYECCSGICLMEEHLGKCAAKREYVKKYSGPKLWEESHHEDK